MSDPVARRLAGAMVAIRDDGLPAEVEARACVLLRDYLGVTLGGVPEPSSVAIRLAAERLGDRGDATVMGTSQRHSPALAALANGAAAHALELDDTHQGGSIHLGAPIFSAALAACELHEASGAIVLRAVVAGYEVAARLAVALDPAVHYARGFHPTGTCGAFGAATAAALIAGLDAERLAAALGIVGSQAAGSMEFLTDGTWTKRLHPGWAAHAGLHAAALAGAGYQAPATIFEGRFGTLHAYSEGAEPDALLTAPDLALMRTSIKPHACCRYAQGPIDGVLELRARHALAPDRVARIDIGLVDAAFPIICEPLAAKRRPTSVVDAQFSLPFCAAVALTDGVASAESFTPARFTDPTVQRVMDVVHAERDPELDAYYPAVWPAWVRITTHDGERLETRVMHPKGDPENFPSAGELTAKFETLAGRVLSAAEIARLTETTDAFPALPDARPLLAQTVPGVTTSSPTR